MQVAQSIPTIFVKKIEKTFFINFKLASFLVRGKNGELRSRRELVNWDDRQNLISKNEYQTKKFH